MNFNKTTKTNSKSVSYEGGQVYQKNLEEDWLNFLCSCMLENQFYESAGNQMERYLGLTDKMFDKYGAEFIGKASMFVRNEIGMRSIAQLTAAYLNDKKFERKSQFYRSFCHRPDDVAEVFAALDMLEGKRSHAMVNGFKNYLSGLDEYSIDKYKMKNKQYNMFDCINICHANSDAIDSYKRGTLKQANTWEQRISASNSEEEKSENWNELVLNGSLGYLALIRNIRNIINGGIPDEVEAALVEQLTNKAAIHKSLVFPYQIYSAYRSLKDSAHVSRSLAVALESAFVISVDNMPKINGVKTIMLDVSGSMDNRISARSDISLKECGACYAIAIYLANEDVNIIKFGTSAKMFNVNAFNGVFGEIERLADNDGCGYGTQIDKAFNVMDYQNDHLFIISDMQIMNEHSYYYSSSEGINSYKKYRNKYGKCEVYSFDLANYRTQVANSQYSEVHLLTSLSPKIFDFISLTQRGENIVDYIHSNYSF